MSISFAANYISSYSPYMVSYIGHPCIQCISTWLYNINNILLMIVNSYAYTHSVCSYPHFFVRALCVQSFVHMHVTM